MVDAVVSSVVDKLSNYLVQEAVLLGGLKNEVEWILRELKRIQCFIKDAELRKRKEIFIDRWISEVRDIACKTEDVFDEYMLKVHEEETLNAVKFDHGGPSRRSRPTGGIAFGLKSPFRYYWNGKYKLFIGKEIVGLNEKITELFDQSQLYGLAAIRDERSWICELREETIYYTPSKVERNVVGLVNGIDELLAKLVDDEDPSRLVISLCGMGGLGKTTLAKKLYCNEGVVKRFEHRVWIYVSQDYDMRDLLLRIAKSLKIAHKEPLENKKEEDLEELIQQFLKVRSYLLVIDDVWKKEVLSKILKAAFPDNQNGSRVIITTRLLEVAKGLDKRTHIHQLKTLNSNESLQLFCEEAYGDVNHSLTESKKNIVKICQGLPLAIVVLTGLLFGKRSSEELQMFRLRSGECDLISNLLALSIEDLRCHLKLCFLYLSLFPEDSKINAENVIRLWVAEGLVYQDDDLILEDIAALYLNELANRRLIQVEETHRGRITYFRVHDLVRDLAIQKGRELNFMHVQYNNNPGPPPALCRRQATHHGVEMYFSSQEENPKLRTFFSFEKHGKKETKLTQLLETLSEESKLLRVLNITRDAPGKLSSFFHILKYSIIPEQIGTLIHLRYLGIKNVRICKVPSSIGNLKNLQTLDFLCYPKHRIRLPVDICKLTELRHLLGEFVGHVPIDNLTKLQTLKYVSCQSWIQVDTENLVSLRELCIRQANEEEGDITEFPFESLAKLKSLRILSVVLRPSTTFSWPLPLRCYINLVDLTLRGKMEKLPADMHKSFPYLEHLSLQIYNMRDDPMATLEKLPFLAELELNLLSYGGPEKMVCSPFGFLGLEILTFMVSELDELQVEEGGMPRIRSFRAPADHKFAIPERLRAVFNQDC